jgi:hypothetical protein
VCVCVCVRIFARERERVRERAIKALSRRYPGSMKALRRLHSCKVVLVVVVVHEQAFDYCTNTRGLRAVGVGWRMYDSEGKFSQSQRAVK